MSPSLLSPTHTVLIVDKGETVAVFRLCSCSSTSVSPERGLEGTLMDLRWGAMIVLEAEVFSFVLWK